MGRCRQTFYGILRLGVAAANVRLRELAFIVIDEIDKSGLPLEERYRRGDLVIFRDRSGRMGSWLFVSSVSVSRRGWNSGLVVADLLEEFLGDIKIFRELSIGFICGTSHVLLPLEEDTI